MVGVDEEVEGPVDDRSHRRRRASVYAMVLSGFPVFLSRSVLRYVCVCSRGEKRRQSPHNPIWTCECSICIRCMESIERPQRLVFYRSLGRELTPP